MKALLWLVVVCVMFLYPVLVYFGLQQFGPKLLASLLALVLVVRTSLTWGKADFKGRAFSVLAVLYCLCIVLLNSVGRCISVLSGGGAATYRKISAIKWKKDYAASSGLFTQAYLAVVFCYLIQRCCGCLYGML